jgi:hypothetical protein
MLPRNKSLLVSSFGLLLALTSCLGVKSYAQGSTVHASLLHAEVPVWHFGEHEFLVTNASTASTGPLTVLAQADGQTEQSSDSSGEEDATNFVIGLAVLMMLPLFWKPTRKAIGLLNIIVGAILTLTGIGAIIGIPMILVGGICLFV